MRSFSVLAVLAGLSSLAFGQGTLPPCAQHCYTENLQIGGCGASDAQCICTNTALISKLSCCVLQTCDKAAIEQTEKFSQNICAVFGVTNLPTVASCAGTGTAQATGSATAGTHLTRPSINPGPIIHTSLNSKQSAIIASLDSKLTLKSKMTGSMTMTSASTTAASSASSKSTGAASGAGATSSSTGGAAAAAITGAPVGLAGALALGAFALL